MLRLELSYRGMLAAGLAALTIFGLIALWPVVLVVITSLIFMGALLPYVGLFVRMGLPRVAAVLLVLLVIVLVLVGLMALVVPAMVDQFQSIGGDLPTYARDLEDQLREYGAEVELEQRARDIDWGKIASGSAASYGQQVVLTLFSIVTILVVTAYLLIEAPRIAAFIFQFVPPGREPEAERLLQSLSRVVGGYVRGQAITSGAIAVFTFVVLFALGVEDPLAYAVLAGFVDIIPLVGAFIAIIPPAIAAYQQDPVTALIVVGLLTAYQQFEDRILVPRVYGSTLNLSPLIVLLAALSGAQLLGIVGVLLALPAAAAARVGVDYWLERRHAAVVPTGPTDQPAAPDID